MKNKQLTKSLLAIFMLLTLIGCNKEKNTITEYIGTVIEGTMMAPLPDVKVSVANGSRVLVSTVTDEEGAFSMYVNFDKVTERDSLIIDGNPGLPYVKKFELKGMGKEQYDYRTLVLYNKSNTEVKTSEVTSIKANSAVCGGTVTEGTDILVTQRGVCWSKQPEPTLSNNSFTLDGEGGGQFTSSLTGLEEQTRYYVRAYATNGEQVVYGSQKDFTTPALLPSFQYAGTTYYVHPEVGTMTWQSAIDYCENLTFAGCSDWFLPDKDELNTMYVNRNTIGGFVTTWTHSSADCRYWSSTESGYYGQYAWFQSFENGYQNTNDLDDYYRVRPVRKDGGGGGGGGGTTPVIPTVITSEPSNVSSSTATCGGSVTSDGGASIIQRGVCFSTSQNPTTSSQIVTSGTGTGLFTCNLTGLSANTTYYVRAYAINSVGTGYGTQKSFRTDSGGSAPVLPTVSTSDPSNVTTSTAICGGNVTSDGGADVTQRGVCYSTSQNPTTSSQIVTSGTGTGSFTCNLTGLSANTKYYVRAYAINSEGTAYGAQKDFTTQALTYTTFEYAGTTYYVHPEVGTMTWQSAIDYCNNLSFAGFSDWYLPDKNELNAMYVYRNTIGGFITYTGTDSHYWSSTPENDDNAWYQRFSTGSQDYAYKTSYKRVRPVRKDGGGGITPVVPTVITSEPSGTTSNSTTCGGNVTSDGGASVSQRGICYSTSQNPTTSDFILTSGTGTGSFTCNLTGLTANTTYYVRAFAVNSAGTGYGTQKSFQTESGSAPIDGWLYYDDIDVVGHVGLTNGGTFYWANMFPPSMLSPYSGTGVSLIEAHLDVTGNYTLQIYQGGQNSPGTLLFQDNCNVSSAGGYVQFTLSSPVYVNAAQNLWIVIGKTHAAGEYPAGYSNLSSNPNSRWLSVDGEWVDSEEYTWVLHTYVTNEEKGTMRIETPSHNHKKSGNRRLIKSTISK